MYIPSYLLSQDLAYFLITLTLQAILISLLGFTAVNLLSKKSAPVRSLVCTGAIVALGLVLVISSGFRVFEIAWTQNALPVLLEENRANSPLFSELKNLSPAETISPLSLSESQISIEGDMVYAYATTSSHSKQFVLLVIINLLGLIWLTGFLFQLLKLIYGIIMVKKFKNSLSCVPDDFFNEMVLKIARDFWKNRIPELYSSPKIVSPITIGLLNPVVIIPEILFKTLNENELKSILLHELAHIYHYDQVMGVIKRIVQAVHWWNPLVYVINRKHEQAREEVSDNYVLREFHPKAYTRCLTDLAEKVCLISNFPTAIGMAGKKINLRVRVEHILSEKRSIVMRTKTYLKSMIFAICLALTFGIAGLHGKVKSKKLSDIVIDKHKNISSINTGSSFEKENKLFQEKTIEFETNEEQDVFRTTSNNGAVLHTKYSGKEVLKNVRPVIIAAHEKNEIAKNHESKIEPDKVSRKPVLYKDIEDTIVLVQKEPPLKVSLDNNCAQGKRDIESKIKDASSYISQGINFFKKGQFNDAVSSLNRAIYLDPEKAAAYIARGSAYYRLDRLHMAIADYNKAIELNPNIVVTYQNRGSVYYRLDRLNMAIADYNRAIELNPEFTIAYLDRGRVYYKKRKFDKAIADYSKAIELDTDDAVTYTCRGAAYLSDRKYKEALIDLNKAIELNPEYADAYINRGAYYCMIKKYNSAISDYKKALKLDPDGPLAKRLWKYSRYDSAAYLLRVVNSPDFAENTLALRYR